MKSGADSISVVKPATSGELCPPPPVPATYCTTMQSPLSSADGYSLSVEDGLPRIMKGESFITHGEPVFVREQGKTPRIVMPAWSVSFKLDSASPNDPVHFLLQTAKLMTNIKLAASGDLSEHCGDTTGVAKGTVNVFFTGMADTTGSDPYNRDLSRQRYRTVTGHIKAMIGANPNVFRAPYGVNFYAFAAGEQPARLAAKGKNDNVDDPRYRRVDAAISTGKLPTGATWEKIDFLPAVDAPPAPPKERGVIQDGVVLCDETSGRGPGNMMRLSHNEHGALTLDLCDHHLVIGETEPLAIMLQGALQTIHPWRIVELDDQGRLPPNTISLETALWNEMREAQTSTGFMKTCAANVVENYKGVRSVRVDIVVGSAEPKLVSYADNLKRRLEEAFPKFVEVAISFQPAHETRFPKRSVAIQPTVVFNGDAGSLSAWYTFESVPPKPIELIDVETVTP